MGKRKRANRPLGIFPLAARLALVAAALLAVRALSDKYDRADIHIPDGLGRAVLAMELPGARWDIPDTGAALLLSALPAGGGVGSGDIPDTPYPVSTAPEESSRPVTAEPSSPPADPTPSASEDVASEPSTPAPSQSPAAGTPAVGTTITGAGGGYTDLGEGIYIKNRTDYDIDVNKLLKKPFDFSDASAVLIVHTHGSEAYNPAGEDVYVPSDPSRTEDKSFNVVRVGDELEKLLTDRGITVYHDRELHDYPSYAGSYERTLEAIKAKLGEHPEISVVIDLHRDALDGDGKVYKTVADIGDTPSAQVMLICGSDFSGLKHPNWRENLSFALKLQKAMVTKYPTLARPLKISEYRYNQHATTGSLIAEVGTNGNTLQEALTAVRYFGDCLASVLSGES